MSGSTFWRRAGLAGRAVAVEQRFLAGAVQHDALHHLPHLGCGEWRNHSPLLQGMKGDHLRAFCGSVVAATILGATHTPSLAMVEINPTSCNGVIPISCPVEIAAIDTLDQRLTGLVNPLVSPGSSIPVG